MQKEGVALFAELDDVGTVLRCSGLEWQARAAQAGDDWAGCIVADVLGMDATSDKKRLKRIIETWLKSGALVKVKHKDANRIERPCLEVGEWATE
ncbi:hypothetical protein [Thalassobius litoralis]|uniref:hypothetical protein n=1 Tax=Thalassovita litoralis TaxID=1010611 RepID=UPI001F453879|nr:hypothetical protein [Thalassovita litoralis]